MAPHQRDHRQLTRHDPSARTKLHQLGMRRLSRRFAIRRRAPASGRNARLQSALPAPHHLQLNPLAMNRRPKRASLSWIFDYYRLSVGTLGKNDNRAEPTRPRTSLGGKGPNQPVSTVGAVGFCSLKGVSGGKTGAHSHTNYRFGSACRHLSQT